ncbi:MAG TPA: serine/threonine-protein kinase [Polyangia bacterium]
MGRLKTRVGALVAALAILGMTAGAAVILLRLERARLGERLTDEAQASALRAADGVRTLLGTLEVQVQNGTANPRLVAALDAKVDEETLRDLLLNEPWWEPFRRSVDAFGLYTDETAAVVTSKLPAGFEARGLVHDARASHRTASGLVLAQGQVLAVTAGPVALTSRADWPVLVAARALDVGILSGIAERAGASVAISDGRRLLVAATVGTAAGLEDQGLAPLKQALDLATPGIGLYGPVAVATVPLSGGLRILAGTAAPAAARGALPLPGVVLAILAIGLVLAIGSFVLLARRPPPDDDPIIEMTTANPVTVIGRYTLIDRIGLGGMAEIYSAVTTGEGSFRRPVVIKRLRPELTTDPNAVAQFCDEANLLAALHHPNIVAVHDFGRWQNQFFLAEEYLQGRDLGRIVSQSLVRNARPLPAEMVAFVAHEILKGLDYAHGLENDRGRPMGIVHRDVSPENVVVSPRSEVKLLDFGVVKAAEGRVTKTEMGVVKGNVTYMSPEQARGLDVDGRADLFSLALVMYFCCAGHPLYAAHTTYGLLMQAGAGPNADGRTEIQRLPEPIARVVQRATDPELGRRYANAREMAADLEAGARNGAALAGALVTELFGGELKEEAHRLATFPLDGSAPPVASASTS